MDESWLEEFHKRMDRFGRKQRGAGEGVAISIKVRVASGCFHREHSPRAYELIGPALPEPGVSDFDYVEHESGPELLVYLAGGLLLAKSVVELITVIIKARAEGIKKGDNPSAPLELIVRRVYRGSEFKEEIVLRIGHTESVDPKSIEKQLVDAAKHLSSSDTPPSDS